MRKLTAQQVAAMVTAVGVLAPTALRLRVPILALTPIILTDDAQASLGGELEEVVVTATSIKHDVILNRVLPQQTTQVGRQVGHAAAGSTLSAQTKQAQKCALLFSKGALGPYSGTNPAITMIINSTQYGWGTRDPTLPSPVVTNTNVSPGPKYFRINGQTLRPATNMTYIFEKNVALDAVTNGISFKREMLRALVHEWYHEWFDTDDVAAEKAADAAEQAYLAAGGDSLTCNSRPAP